MKLEDLKTKYKWAEPIRKVNYINIPKNFIPSTEEGAREFNAIYKCVVLDSPYEPDTIKRTKSGGIHKRKSIRIQYDIQILKNAIELTYIGPEGMYRWIFNGRPEGITGGKSFTKFIKKCEKHNVDLSKFAIKNGKEVKETIEDPMIELYGKPDKIYLNVHHLDINSSYMAGISNAQPELKGVIQEIYDNRKVDKVCKDILTHTYGYMQCKWCQVDLGEEKKSSYAFAHLSKAAVAFNNRMIEDLMNRLESSGRRVLATNTDGIWYQGEVFHDIDEGKELGQWKNDHIDCRIRFKSKGCYEFIENDKYYPVVRGRTRLDRIKVRENWQWGDIYQENCDIIKYRFDPAIGVVVEYEKIKADVVLFEEI